MIVLDHRVLVDIKTHAAKTYPDECCGALVGNTGKSRRIVTAVWPIANTAGESSRRFAVSASDYQCAETRARDRGVVLLGFYHSHPDAPATPSPYDLSHAWPNFDYIIVSVARGRPADITCWRLREDRSAFEAEDIRWRTVS